VLDTLDPKDAELLKLRHLLGEHATRDEVAAMARLTVGEFRWRYARAWSRFIEAVALDAPSPRCARTRQLIGELEAGTAPPEVSAEIDAHTLDCPSCLVFARESYRALELLPFVPAVGLAERLSARMGCWWDRAGSETTAGAGTAATGAGIWALLGGGSTAGLVKVVAILCSATAVTAGVCAGVIAVMEGQNEPRRAPATHAERQPPRPTLTPQPKAVATPAPTATPTPTATPEPRRRMERREEPPETTVDTSGESPIPASAPADASEFDPGGSSGQIDPATATTAGGGEFSP
jgi:hypothetical protein